MTKSVCRGRCRARSAETAFQRWTFTTMLGWMESYSIFTILLKKERLNPAYDYDDELFAERFR